eukprot:s9192_g1.t1
MDGSQSLQQVMSAQPARAKSSVMLNGSYGSMGVMDMDSELRTTQTLEAREGTVGSGHSTLAQEESGVGVLRAAAGRVMTNVAAKVQGALPVGKAGPSAPFLPQEESVSAGTVDTGFATAVSRATGDEKSDDQQGMSTGGLFSPQQARRLREMQSEAPLLYSSEGATAQSGATMVSGGAPAVPPLPHSASSDSGQAEAIQAEVRRQMQAFVEMQSELQRRVVALMEENQMLRQAASAEVGSQQSPAQQGRTQETPTMATAAKIQAQLEDLEARMLDGRPRVRSITCGGDEEREDTALLDSGATHAVLDSKATEEQPLVPCTVSLAGDQKQVWHQTPGGSLVAPCNGEGGTAQTILPLGLLVHQLGCSLRWSRRDGLQLVHPRLGRLKTSLKGGCPQLNKSQALQLVKELESAKLGELDGRLRRVQAHLSASEGIDLDQALDNFVGSGSLGAAIALIKNAPFLAQVPNEVSHRLAVDLEGINVWEVIKGLPFNRRVRKRLHQSHMWVVQLGIGQGDPIMSQACKRWGIELVQLDTSQGATVKPEVWKALSWAAFTGRIAGIIANAPMRTWSSVQTTEEEFVWHRSVLHPWGTPSNSRRAQERVEADTWVALQPMWLWTVASGPNDTQPRGPDAEVDVVRAEGVLEGPSAAGLPEGLPEGPSAAGSPEGPEAEGVLEGPSAAGLPEGPEAEGVPEGPSAAGLPEGHGAAGLPEGPEAEGVPEGPSAAGLPEGHGAAGLPEGPKAEGVLEGPSAAGLPEGPSAAGSPEGPEAEGVLEGPSAAGLPEGGGVLAEASESVPRGHLTPKEREKWKRHIAAHHLPFGKDCLQCVMSGALGLQHRRVKCPNMYALSFDLTGPFQEKGLDDRGGGYKYALVAGLRVPDIALPEAQSKTPVAAHHERPGGATHEEKLSSNPDPDEIEWSGSEVSWLHADLEPRAEARTALPDVDEESESEAGEVNEDSFPKGAGALDDGEELFSAEPSHQDSGGREGIPVEGIHPPPEDDPWADKLGVGDMSDEQFDAALLPMTFGGANKVLRFVVPIKSRQGPHILAGLQEVIVECNRLGYPVKVAHTDRAKELMSKATMEWLQSKLIQPSFTQGDDPKANGLAERLVGWVKARARLHLAASGLGLERWPSAMEFACAEHRARLMQTTAFLPRFGQQVVFKSKHPTGKSKRPFVRWEHAVYLHPSPRTEGGHVLLRAASNAFLVAKNVRCLNELFDPEREFKGELIEAEVQDPPENGGGPKAPERRVTGKRAVRAVQLASEAMAARFLEEKAFSQEDCSRLLDMAFSQASGGSRRQHRGSVGFSTIMGAYCHGGLRGITRASQVHPELCRYLNGFLRHSCQEGVSREWSAVMVMVADSVSMHRDARNEPGSQNVVAHVTSRKLWVEGLGEAQGAELVGEGPVMQIGPQGEELQGYTVSVGQEAVGFNPKCRHMLLPATNWVIAGYTPLGSSRMCRRDLTTLEMSAPEWTELCQLDEEQFERAFERWQRVLGGADEDQGMNPLSAAIPQSLLVATVLDQRNWEEDPILSIGHGDGTSTPVARVYQFSDDGYVDDMPFPDRMLLFSIHDFARDVFEMIILRVELIENPAPLLLEPPGPPPPEIRSVRGVGSSGQLPEVGCLPIPLPNPAFLKLPAREGDPKPTSPEAFVNKAEVTTKDLEGLLESLREPLCITHTASQEEVRANLAKWKGSIVKELEALKGPGVLISHKGKDARDRMNDSKTTVIPLKGVFTVKPPSASTDGLFKRKCRLVGCGNQTSHVDAESLYAAGAPAEVVRSALVEAARQGWSAFTTDIRSAFTTTPMPEHAAKRYLLRPPRWLVELGLVEPGEYFSLGKVLYGFKEAPSWWAEFRDRKLTRARFAGYHLEQGKSDPSIWRIMSGSKLAGYLVTYVDDFLILSGKDASEGLHKWLTSEAGWETDGLSEASHSNPVRFLGMQLCKHKEGHFSLDQEAYVDELVRAYGLTESDKSKITCPRELLMCESEEVQPYDEITVRAAQKLAGECLWVSQRTRFDVAFCTTILCSKVSRDPHGAIAVGLRLLAYLHHTKAYKLHLRCDKEAPPLRVYTDASFSPQGQNSYGGHVVEVYGAPVLWRASKQSLIALSSSEAELIQAVEGCTYAESLMTVLRDLGIPADTAELHLDNTASISFIGGGGNQRTRHLKVRGHKIRQLVEGGWVVKHCRGEKQKADLLTKPLPSHRTKFLCSLLQLGTDEEVEQEPTASVRQVQVQNNLRLSSLLLLLQSCLCVADQVEESPEPGVAIDWPWELAVLTLLVVLSTLFVWEASGAPCRRRSAQEHP